MPIFGHYIWPKALDFIETHKIEKWKFIFYFSWIYNFIWYFFINFLFWIVYHIEHPFFEQYKIIKEPWPWNQDRKAWNELLKRSIIVVIFNNAVIIPALVYLQLYLFGYDTSYSFELEDLPDSKTFLLQ